ncbi:hypothetical protein PAXRUDRAFT_18108 [Paxillus rubicundulus Ve08.2h10]|uniref:Uncharacterized protein n=1 Tax=Paxillus rubicundulus Ve08.2h10 TaxID=930991 RepID=A0A0D0CMP2_9AGAM|nr:hypothetical protein PAXRUDRAFT_18108 [Paxillus rubicundulus Ve08.2h10]
MFEHVAAPKTYGPRMMQYPAEACMPKVSGGRWLWSATAVNGNGQQRSDRSLGNGRMMAINSDHARLAAVANLTAIATNWLTAKVGDRHPSTGTSPRVQLRPPSETGDSAAAADDHTQ